MQAQIAWPLIQALGKGHFFNLSTGDGVVVTVTTGTSQQVTMMNWNPNRPIMGPAADGSVCYGFKSYEMVRGRVENVFNPDPKIVKAADYKDPKGDVTLILYTDGSVKRIPTFTPGLPKDIQQIVSIEMKSPSEYVITINAQDLAKVMSKAGKSFKVLTAEGASHRFVVTPSVTDKMAANILRNNDQNDLKAMSQLWKVLNK